MTCPDAETLQSFLEGRLERSRSEELRAHAEGCPVCRAVLIDWARERELDATPMAEGCAGEAEALHLPRGTKVDHFVVLDALGSGGMGVLVSAYDPNLDRKVAIKLVRPGGPGSTDAGERRARLVREAHALAKLTHENVVTVYQAGTYGEHVYIAMELVVGGTLTTWLRRARRSWREVVTMFLRVGRGLEAAHAAGFVHRDFKPENVLVGDDGRVRVSDFGLVGTAGTVAEPSETPARASPHLTSLTRTGSVIGTPRYMAPEQHDAAPLDARADQFAFAVTLYDALYGMPPFPGTSYDELAANVRGGVVRAAPAKAKVPAWLRRIVLRGLARAPDDRYPSMTALLADLGRIPRRGRQLTALAAVAALVITAALVTWRVADDARQSCSGAERNLAGIWDRPTRERGQAAFRATGTPYADDAWAAGSRELDRYSVAWTQMHRSVCVAAREGELSAAALDLRMGCLGRRLDNLRAVAGLFASADASVVEKATTTAAGLEPLDGCADLVRLSASLPLPEDARRRAGIAWARRLLAEAVARHDAGKYVEALPGIWTALTFGRVIPYPPLEAEALYRLGRLQDRLGDAAAAEETLFAATAAATRAGHVEVAADAQIELIFVAGVIGAKAEVGRHAGEQGAALLQRLGGEPERRAKLLRYQGFLLDAEGRYPEARTRFVEALALEEQLSGGRPSYQLAGVLTAIFKNDHREGRYEEALPIARRALAMLEETLGPHHPFVGLACTNLGAVLESLRRYPEALALHQRSLAIQEAALGPDHPEVAFTLANVASGYASVGRYDEAIAASQRAIDISGRMPSPHEHLAVFHQILASAQRKLGRLADARTSLQLAVEIQEKKWGPDDVTLAQILHDLGHVLRLEGKFEQAYQAYRRAHAIFEKRLGPDHEETAAALASTGVALAALGRAAEGLTSVERARATLEKKLGPHHSSVGAVDLQLGNLHRDLAHHELATLAFERAVAILKDADVDPRTRAEARIALATQLWTTSRDRPRASALIRDAQQDLAPLGSEADDDRQRVTAWLAERGR